MILDTARGERMSVTSESAAGAGLKTARFAAPRRHLRFSLAAEADVTAVRNGRHLVADVSELSARGCYLDTPEPFSAGAEVRLCIRRAGSSCELLGRVIYAHRGWGMGVLFADDSDGQFHVLDEWLAELELEQRQRDLERLPGAEQPRS
jgi:PilZ domain